MTEHPRIECGSLYIKEERPTKCPVCGHEGVEGHGMCIQIGENFTEHCAMCFAKFIAQHVPKVEIIEPKVSE